MTSDARAGQLIREYFEREWPRICPDATFAVSGPPSPRDEVFVHLQVDAKSRWIFLRCWVPRAVQIEATDILHQAARAILDDAVIPSDDGRIVVGRGNRFDIEDDVGDQWMSAITFPFRLA